MNAASTAASPPLRSDDELLHAWRTGDRRAGNCLVDRYLPVVTDFLRHRRACDVEDLAQATFLACVENRRCYRGTASFKTYLLAIATRQLAMCNRKAYRRDRALRRPSAGPTNDPAPSRVAEAQEEVLVLEQAMQGISPELRELVMRFYWQEQSVSDIAAQLHIPTGTVKSRLSRVRSMLRKHIDRIYEPSPSTSFPLPGRHDLLWSLRAPSSTPHPTGPDQP